MKKNALILTISLLNFFIINAQCNQTYNWANWQNFYSDSAIGVINNNGNNVGIKMTANYSFGSTPDIYNYTIFSGFNGMAPNATVPKTTWAVGSGGITTMCFDQQVKNPVLLLSSIGSAGAPVTLKFSRPYKVVFNGGGNIFSNDSTITGAEGYAIIVFPGDFTCVSIFSTTPEYYTNITWGLNPPLFPLNVVGNKTGCDSVSLTAIGGISYAWSGGLYPFDSTNVFKTSGTYFMTAKDINGCTVITTVDVVVNNSSKTDFSFTQNTCNPKQITFSNQTPNTSSFLWSFGNNTTNSISQIPVVVYSAFNNYNVKLVVTQTNGCIDSVEKNIAANTQLVDGIIKNIDTTICLGASFKLNVVDTGLGFCWNASAGSINSNVVSPTVAPTSNTTYYFNYKSTGNNLVVNGDFENGNTGFTSDYVYQTPPRTSQSQYYIGTNPNTWFNPFVACKDHTSNSGKMMMFDGSAIANTAMWKQTVPIQPNTDYLFSGWVQSIVSQDAAQIVLNINGIKVGSTTTAILASCNWKQFSAIWNSGSNTTANLSILDNNLVVQGNDFAIDDISFAPIIIKTDSVNVNVVNCNTNRTCKGVLELHGSDRVSLPTPFTKYFSTTGFTWETWFNSSYYANNDATLDDRNKLIAMLDVPLCQDIVLGFGWPSKAPKHSLCFVVDGNGGCANQDNTPCTYKPAGGFVPNTWYHVAGVRDYSNNTSKLYVNGVLVDTKTNNHSTISPSILTSFIMGNYVAGLDSGFAGKMDEIRIWKTARTASEIQANYNRCLSGTETGLVAYYRSNEATAKTLNDATKNGNNATLSSTAKFDKTDNAPIINGCLQATESFDTATICIGQNYWGHNTSNTYIDTLVNSVGCDSLRYLKLTVNVCTTASFTAPDTVCVNAPVMISNTSTGATTYNWNYCSSGINTTVTGVNLGTLGGYFSQPVFMDYVEDGGNYYGFVVNHNPGGIVRLDFGNSLLNTPTSVFLGNIGGLMNASGGNLGIQIKKQNSKYFMFVVGGTLVNGTVPIFLRYEFGTNITNTTPTGTDFGNIGNIDQPHQLYMWQENTVWYGLVFNSEANTITRINFTNDFTNPPTGINLGNIGNLNFPTNFDVVNDNGNYRVFVNNTKGNSMSRLDFGTSLLNTPTGVNLGNISNLLNYPRAIVIKKNCDGIYGYISNQNTNDIVKIAMTSYTTKPTGISLGNIGNLTSPQSFSKEFTSGSDIYCFVHNVGSNTLSRLKFSGCNNSSTSNSTSPMPPSISYNAAGTYNINLTIDEGLPTQSFYCKKVVVVSAPILTITPNITSCYDSVVQLNVSGASSYSWSPKTWLNDSTIANPIATPQSTVKYIVSAKNSIGCAAKDSVTITVLPKATTTKDTIKNCGSVVYNFIIYTKDSLLTSNKKNYLGCDSIIQQHQIIIAKEKYDTISKSICTNQSYLGHNITGFYPIDTIHLASGCDNINILKLTVDSYIRDTIFPVICFDSSFKKHNTTGIYFDTIHAPAFCDTLQLINLTVKKPNPTLPSDTSICSGDILTLYPGKFINYIWNNTTTTSTLKVQNVGTYWVIVKDTFGCQVTDTFKLISLYDKPANFLPNQLTICTGERFTVPNYVSYKWITGETTATIHLNGLPNYWVKVTDKNQCLGSDTMKIIYSGFDKFSLINAFTPNNDGYNDFFKPLTGSCIIAFSMFIYNRWGQLVYQTHNLQGKGWDGYINESQAPIGVYYYIITYKNINDEQKKQTGSVTLLR